MALVKFGGGITQMSGSIAGNTFARNRYGNYVRARTKPTNPNSTSQQLVRSALNTLTVRWSQVLSAEQRAAWNLYGTSVSMLNKLGESTFLTGFNHYIRSNSNLVRLCLPPVDDGPVIFELPEADPAFAITATEDPNSITAAYDDTLAWAAEAGGWLFMFQGSPQNAQRNFFAGPWRLWAAVQGFDAAPPPSPKISPAVFTIAELQHLWVYARILRADGRLSSPFRDDVFVTA